MAGEPGIDAVLIPGGGLTSAGGLPTYVIARLERAIAQRADYYIALSAGTVFAPQPLDPNGQPLYEAMAAAEYLRKRGIPERRILTETSSYDTIGNAFFARMLHAEPRGLQKLLIITSEFHMERVEAIFRWVFGVSPDAGYDLTFEATENVGISPEALLARRTKERDSMPSVRELAARIRSIRELCEWMYSEHAAYAWFLRERAFRRIEGLLRETY